MNKISEIQLKYSSVKIINGRVKIKHSQSAYEAILGTWNLDTIELYEEFKVVLLNRANEVLGIHTLSKGGISGTIVDLKLLFAVALKSASSAIILVHNHPSGNLNPSEQDKQLYKKIKGASELLDINVLDNLIISKYGYYSFTDKGV